MGVLKGCQPRDEVLKGDLEDSIFAADFGDLVADTAPKVYKNAKTFFQNTYPTKQLCKVCETVFNRLASSGEGGATIRLSTGFGGGKTHTLMALWHLAKNINDASMGTELLPAAGRPTSLTVIGIDAGKAGVPNFATHGRTVVHSLHGEVFYQLGGARALKSLGDADHPESSPGDAEIRAAFPDGPVLILLDELVVYMAKLSERGQGNLLGFIKSLSSVVEKQNAVLIVTDPAGQAAYAAEAAKIDRTLAESAAGKLDDMFDRKVSDFDPIGDEAPRVIVRRLFKKVKSTDAEKTSAQYHQLYSRVAEEQPGLLPASAASAEYAKRIVECYPFHPRLLETAQNRLGAMDDFQKSRGVLRLFARILRDVWEAQSDLPLITGGDIHWDSPRIQGDLLQRLKRDAFKTAVSADIEGHARELDDGGRGVHSRVASALLLESLPLHPNSGLDAADLTLAVLRPDEAGHEPSEALDRLLGVCWHTYPMPGERGYQFRYDPNVIKQIEEMISRVPREDAYSRIQSQVQQDFAGVGFKLAAWPDAARDVRDFPTLQLVLCDDEERAKAVCSCADDSNPDDPMPRKYLNAIVGVAATPGNLRRAVECAQRLTAAERLEAAHKGETGKLVREQLQKIKPEYIRQFRLQAFRAFDVVVVHGKVAGHLDEKYQVAEEQILQRACGQTCLGKFLDDNRLIYQPGDALDSQLFLSKVLSGTTPLADNPEAYTGKAVYERFMSAPDLRLVPDHGVVRKTLLKAVTDGKLVVRLGDGRAYDAEGCVGGEPGLRRRYPTETLTSFPLDDTLLVTRANSATAAAWLEEDKVVPPGDGDGDPVPQPPPPPEPAVVTATTWEQILEYAAERPLLKLQLIADKPSDAAALAGLAQPLGADSLTLGVSVSGQFKDAGFANFAVNDVRPNHAVKPLAIAQTLFTAMTEATQYEASLTLLFGVAGRGGMGGALRTLSENVPQEIRPEAKFDKPPGAKR